MAAGIAHEVRNPLGSIQLYAQMLAEDVAGQPDQVELCAKIQRAVMGLDAVVRDVLSFARETTIRPEPTTADDLLDRALASCASLLVGIEVDRERSVLALDVCADAGLIVQALGNVIRNAVEAMIEGNPAVKRLTVRADRRRVRCSDGGQEPRIVFSIADTGPGISPDVVERVFNPFFTTRKTGTGLGLAIVHRIVDAHGGHVNIKSDASGGTGGAGGAVGTGTIVEINLPLKPPAALAAGLPEIHREQSA
jgi:signal transduction histidine kinase